jgi:hypothetical protein
MPERLLAYQSETIGTEKLYVDMNVDLGKASITCSNQASALKRTNFVEAPNDRQIVDLCLPQPSRMFGIDIHILDVIESTTSLEGACNGERGRTSNAQLKLIPSHSSKISKPVISKNIEGHPGPGLSGLRLLEGSVMDIAKRQQE